MNVQAVHVNMEERVQILLTCIHVHAELATQAQTVKQVCYNISTQCC